MHWTIICNLAYSAFRSCLLILIEATPVAKTVEYAWSHRFRCLCLKDATRQCFSLNTKGNKHFVQYKHDETQNIHSSESGEPTLIPRIEKLEHLALPKTHCCSAKIIFCTIFVVRCLLTPSQIKIELRHFKVFLAQTGCAGRNPPQKVLRVQIIKLDLNCKDRDLGVVPAIAQSLIEIMT